MSCDSERDGVLGHSGMFKLRLQTDTVQVAAETKAGSLYDRFMNVDDYRIQIIQDGQVVSSFDTYGEMPESVELPSGTYMLKASMGELVPAEFEAPYFAGSTDFVIKEGKSTETTVTSALANAKVTVNYSDDFKDAYPKYSLSMATDHTKELLVFEQGEARAAYFQADSTGQQLRMSLSLTSLENKKITFTPSAIKIKPREDIRLLFKTDGEAVSGVKLEITIDGATIDTTVNVGVPDYMLPLDPPLITPKGFVSGQLLQVTSMDTESPNVEIQALLYAGGTIDSCIMLVNSPYFKVKGWKDRYDLANLSDEDKVVLAGYFPVDAPMYRKRSYDLSFKSTLVKMLCSDPEIAGIHQFTFILKDSLKAHQASDPVVLILQTVQPEVKMTMVEGDVWATRAVLRAKVEPGNANTVLFGVGTRKIIGSGYNWKLIPGQIVVDGQYATLNYTGLTPNTEYVVKAVYGRNVIKDYLSEDIFTFKTEPALQIAETSFENWYKKTIQEELGFPGLGVLVPAIESWYPCKESEIGRSVWSSSNTQTASGELPEDLKDEEFVLNSQTYIFQAGVSRTTEKNTGSYAAKISTAGWGRGEKDGGETAKTEHVTPGRLFLGSDADKKTGIELTSRPTRLVFAYKFEPKNNEAFKVRAVIMNGSKEIGYTETINKLAQSDYRNMSIPFVYHAPYQNLKATHIYIEFISSTAGGNAYVERIKAPTIGAFYNFIGSTLYIDDVNLEY